MGPVGDGPGKQSTRVIAGLEEASPELGAAQGSTDGRQEELTGGLDVGECEKRAREMLRVGRGPQCPGLFLSQDPPGPLVFPHLQPGLVGRAEWV